MSNGIVVGQVVNVQKTPDWLKRQLQNIFRTSILGLYVGEDIVVDGSNNVTSWPGRIGGTLTNTTSTKLAKSTLLGHKAVQGSGTAAQSLGVRNLGAIKSLVAVSTGLALESEYSTLAHGDINSGVWTYMVRNSGTSAFYTADGYTHLVNGVASENILSGPRIFEAVKADGVAIELSVGGNSAITNRVWKAPIAFIMACSAVPTASQRSLSNQLITQYYGM